MGSNELPEWANVLFDQIASTIDFKGVADIAWRHIEPDNSTWGVDVLEIAPALMDLSEFGAEGEEFGYGIIDNVDLVAAQQAFDEVMSVTFGIEDDGNSCITIGGKVKEQNVIVLIYTEPFDDADEEEDEEDTQQ